MRKFLVLAFSILVPLSAHALAPRTFVSGVGLDTNPCSRTQPCRTFAAAMAAVAPSGEVFVLDSAGYGPFTISAAVTIEVPVGVTAGISVPAVQNGITVAAASTDTVVIRGILIDAAGAASNGIDITSAAIVSLDRVTVQNFGSSSCLWIGYGLVASGLSGTHVFVSHSTFTNNCYGVYADATTTATLTANALTLEANGTAVATGVGVDLHVRDSIATEGTGGIYTQGRTTIDNTYIGNMNAAISATVNGSVSMTHSTIVNSTNAAHHDGTGTIYSFGNNTFSGNTNAPMITGTIAVQ